MAFLCHHPIAACAPWHQGDLQKLARAKSTDIYRPNLERSRIKCWEFLRCLGSANAKCGDGQRERAPGQSFLRFSRFLRWILRMTDSSSGLIVWCVQDDSKILDFGWFWLILPSTVQPACIISQPWKPFLVPICRTHFLDQVLDWLACQGSLRWEAVRGKEQIAAIVNCTCILVLYCKDSHWCCFKCLWSYGSYGHSQKIVRSSDIGTRPVNSQFEFNIKFMSRSKMQFSFIYFWSLKVKSNMAMAHYLPLHHLTSFVQNHGINIITVRNMCTVHLNVQYIMRRGPHVLSM